MGQKAKKGLKKFRHLVQTKGFIKAVQILGAKELYNATKKKQIADWKANRPDISPGRIVFTAAWIILTMRVCCRIIW